MTYTHIFRKFGLEFINITLNKSKTILISFFYFQNCHRFTSIILNKFMDDFILFISKTALKFIFIFQFALCTGNSGNNHSL